MVGVQGYLAHKKLPPPRILQQAYAWGPRAVLGRVKFLMSEVPLQGLVCLVISGLVFGGLGLGSGFWDSGVMVSG